jgi:hypothetical protein
LKSERAKKEKTNNYFQKFNLIQLARAEEITHTHTHTHTHTQQMFSGGFGGFNFGFGGAG